MAERKIALPIAEGALALHFGHCQNFKVFTVDESNTITGAEVLDAPPHQPGLLPPWLSEKGVTAVIAGGMGQRAQDLFAAQGIEVCVGADRKDPEELVREWLTGELKSGSNLCDH